MAGMILVNNPGNWSTTFETLTHADWNGCTFADLVFPFFIFILGAAMPLALGRRLERGQPRRVLYLRIARRSAWLILLGLMLNVVAAAPHVLGLRFPGVLQRIGVVYLIAAPIVMNTTRRWRTIWIATLVLGHWALLMAPLAAAQGLAQGHNLSGLVDRALFGRHILTATGDPEGMLGTIPAVASALMGSIAGDWLMQERPVWVRVAGLVGGGWAALIMGLAWAPLLPLNKSLWTGSFVLFTGGVATLVLAIAYVLCDVEGNGRWARPFAWLGLNPLAIYFLAELFGHLIDLPWRQGSTQMTARAWIFWDVLRRLVPDLPDDWLSLVFAVLVVAWWTAVAGALYRRGVQIQV